jgi:hypothetical protein
MTVVLPVAPLLAMTPATMLASRPALASSVAPLWLVT